MDAISYNIAGILDYKQDQKLLTGLDELSKKAKVIAFEQADDASGQNLKRKLSSG
jgi:hypothetical protein